MRFSLILGVFLISVQANALDVNLVTHSGTRALRTWTAAELSALGGKKGEISAQKLLIDESTKNLELNDRADVDLITIYGAGGKMARVPRFMVWRGGLKFSFKQGSLSSQGESGRLLVPSEIFSVDGISKIELSRSALAYPGTHLSLRTNPAASRGEKLYTQSCLACHSLGAYPKLPVSALSKMSETHFNSKHHAWHLNLDAKAFRGLTAYVESLASEKTEVK